MEGERPPVVPRVAKPAIRQPDKQPRSVPEAKKIGLLKPRERGTPDETIATPERTRQDVQKTELQKVSDAMLNRKLASATERAMEGNANQGDQTIFLLGRLKNIKDGDVLPSDFKLNEGSSFEVQNGTETSIVINVISRDNDILVCQVQDQDNPINLPRQAVLDGLLIDGGESVLEQFTEGSPERAVLERHINILKDPDSLSNDPAESEKVDAEIKEAAKANGMLTTESLRELQKNLKAKSSESTPREQEQQARLDAAIKKTEASGNLLSFDGIVKVFESTGIVSADMVEAAKQAASKAAIDLKNYPDSKEARQNAEDTEIELAILEHASNALSKEGPLHQLMQKAEQGTQDLTALENFQKAFESGDLEKILNATPGAQKFTDKEKDEIRKRLKGKNSLLALLAILGLSVVGSIDINEIVGSPQR